MAEQLIFTSAPSGLKPGTRGYTTVAASRGISPPMMAKLEGMSGYRLAFNVSDARAEQNPVAYSHQLLRQGGQTLSLLSRVAACGVDYSGRSNFLAHHLMLGASERPSAGPAWLLQQSQVLRDAWEDQPGYLDDAIALPNGAVEPSSCSTWERVAGDAGWAGELLKKMKDAPRSPLFVVYPLGTDVLALFAEAIALLPASRRWQATFNTYYNTSAPESVCLWRGVLADSPAAKEAARARGASVIDLTSRLDPAPASDFATAARSGESVSDLFVIRQKQATSGVSQEANEIGIVEDKADAEFFDESNDYDLEVLGQDDTPEGSRRTSERQNRSTMVVSAAPPRRRHKNRFAKIAIASGVMLIAISLCVWILISNSRHENQVKEHEARLRQLIVDKDFYAARDEADRIMELSPKIFRDSRITLLASEASEGIAEQEKNFGDKQNDVAALIQSKDVSRFLEMESAVNSINNLAISEEQKAKVGNLRNDLDKLRIEIVKSTKGAMTDRMMALRKKLKESVPKKGKELFIDELGIRRSSLQDYLIHIKNDAILSKQDRDEFMSSATDLIRQAEELEAKIAIEIAGATKVVPLDPEPIETSTETSKPPNLLDLSIKEVSGFADAKNIRVLVSAGLNKVESPFAGEPIYVVKNKNNVSQNDDNKLLVVTMPGGHSLASNKPVEVGKITVSRMPGEGDTTLWVKFEPVSDYPLDKKSIEITLFDSKSDERIVLVLPAIRTETFAVTKGELVVEDVAPPRWNPSGDWKPHGDGGYVSTKDLVVVHMIRDNDSGPWQAIVRVPLLIKNDADEVEIVKKINQAKERKPPGTFADWSVDLSRSIADNESKITNLKSQLKKPGINKHQKNAITSDIKRLGDDINTWQDDKKLADLPIQRKAIQKRRDDILQKLDAEIEIDILRRDKSNICHKLRVILKKT